MKNHILKLNKKKKIIYNIINLLIFSFLFGIGFFSFSITQKLDNTIKQRQMIIEDIWREQARNTLSGLKFEFEDEVTNNEIDPLNESSIYEWCKTHLQGVRNGGPTGDTILVEMPSQKIIWNPSSDVSESRIVYLNDSLDYFADKNTALMAFSEMEKLYSTTANSKNYWNFDGSIEYLEWTILPTDGLGFQNEPLTIEGTKNPNYKSYILILGTQKDEVIKPFKPIEKEVENIKFYLFIFDVFFFIFSMIFISWYIYKDSNCDRESQ